MYTTIMYLMPDIVQTLHSTVPCRYGRIILILFIFKLNMVTEAQSSKCVTLASPLNF